MKQSYKSFVFVSSLYYVLFVVSLPLVYAVTYHISFMNLYTMEWLILSIVFYPIVLIISAIRYGYHRMKLVNQYNK